ncbi:hypothetical protein R5H30_06550 [Sulfitobacter sp. D35]|nr:hypothetical protein [Sulfitobacter sp. D35]MDW4497635.1 hypothetical protein [Sulfitobacter sp. D35]
MPEDKKKKRDPRPGQATVQVAKTEPRKVDPEMPLITDYASI